MQYRLTESRCLILSCLMVVSFLVLPFLPFGSIVSRILMLFYTALMITAPYFYSTAHKGRHLLWLLVGTGIFLAAVHLIGWLFWPPKTEILHWTQVGLDIVCLIFEMFWVGYILRTSILIRKMREPVSGCVLAYLLMGTVFGNIYQVILQYWPDSFVCTTASAITHADMIYFSFITLSTCGFGDILPVTQLPRMVVALETVCGVMYVALFIGRVLSLYGPGAAKSGNPDRA